MSLQESIAKQSQEFLDLIDLVRLKLNDEAAQKVLETHLKEISEHLQNLGVL